MSDSLIGSANKQDDQNVCSVCREPLPAGVAFCPHCGPPVPPEDEPDKGMGFGQTFFRILLVVVLFGAVAIFKLDINLSDNNDDIVPAGSTFKSPSGPVNKKAHSVDFETINNIKVDKSQVREKPSKEGKILNVLKKGAKVTILDSNEEWLKIAAGGKTGWIPKDDLDLQIR
jgi:Bacterial SH3 domain